MPVVLALIGGTTLTLAVLLHWHAWRRLVRDTAPPQSWPRRTATVAFLVGPVCTVGTIAAQIADAPFVLRQIVSWPGYLWLVFFLYVMLVLLVAEVIRPLVRFVDRRARAARRADVPTESPASKDPDQVTRRQFVARAVAVSAVGISAATVARGTYGVLRGPSVASLTVPLVKLPAAGHGFRIAVVSDIHLGPTLGRGFAQRVVDTINSTQPDLIAIVGDLVDGDVDDLRQATAPLARLRARHGAFFVTGNHEYISGAQQWIEHLQELNLRPLQNARTEMPWFDLAGVNDEMGDRYGQAPDYAGALADRDESRAVVLMAHQPVQVHEARRRGVDLQLSGHTHGGQLWPGPLLAGLANPTVAGLEQYGDTQLFVTRGAGAWGPPTRVGAPSDITVVTLASPEA